MKRSVKRSGREGAADEPNVKVAQQMAKAPKAASKQARREALVDFRDFGEKAPLAEIYFLRQVLSRMEGEHLQDKEMALAAAFADVIDGSETNYVRVPVRYVETVRRYAEALESGDAVALPATPAADAVPAKTSEAPGIRLPRNMKLSDDERTYVARLVRLLRSNYWLSHFARILLQADTDCPDMVSIKQAHALLDGEEAVEQWIDKIKAYKRGPWGDHPAIKAVADEWDEIDDYRSDQGIRKLIESANPKR